ncbi:MAG TPA: MogA/MoaB family molybdenum cofactor biosynthesis protein [Pseudogracilibacillus sp.]|nr:MogA/MoaB family molybdenum cofactor biosynthesis protein [Pseudogracilibacillus sp.]
MHHIPHKEIRCLVVTVSDTRTVETDKSGLYISDILKENGHKIVNHVIVPDDNKKIADALDTAIADERVDAVMMSGGTGISERDITIEVVEKYIRKSIPGFGELFRMLSYTEDIGSTAIMSRATAGVMDQNKVVFSMPGSSGAVKLAMQKLIVPELAHIHHELYKHLTK